VATRLAARGDYIEIILAQMLRTVRNSQLPGAQEEQEKDVRAGAVRDFVLYTPILAD
jgi:hypothetical protein